MTNLVYTACCLFKRVQLCATLWTVAHQAPLSMGLPRQEYFSGFPCLPPGDLPKPGIKPASLQSPASSSRFFSFLEKEMATHSSILAWRIPWTEEPGGLQFMASLQYDMTEQLTLSLSHSLSLCLYFPVIRKSTGLRIQEFIFQPQFTSPIRCVNTEPELYKFK